MKTATTACGIILIGLTVPVLSGCGPHKVLVWKDDTLSQQTSPRVLAADEMAVARLSSEHLNRGNSTSVMLFSPSAVGDGQPRLRDSWSVGKAVTPADEQRMAKRILCQFRDRMRELEQGTGTSSASRVIEELYNIAETAGAEGYRELIAITDLEQFTPGRLTTAQIVTADDARFKELVAETLRDRPRLAHPPDKIVVFHALSKDGYEHMTPAQVNRLRQFMEQVFHGWGIRECEIIPV